MGWGGGAALFEYVDLRALDRDLNIRPTPMRSGLGVAFTPFYQGARIAAPSVISGLL